jgi:hypothetical protein
LSQVALAVELNTVAVAARAVLKLQQVLRYQDHLL